MIVRFEFRNDLRIVRKTIGVLVRVIWLALCLAVLGYAQRGYHGTTDWQMEEWLAWQMMALSFPSSLLLVVALTFTGAILSVFPLALPSPSRLEMTGTWLLFVGVGYAQWFVLLPRFLEQRKRRRALDE